MCRNSCRKLPQRRDAHGIPQRHQWSGDLAVARWLMLDLGEVSRAWSFLNILGVEYRRRSGSDRRRAAIRSIPPGLGFDHARRGIGPH